MENEDINQYSTLPETVTHLTISGKEIFLLASAHVSKQSVDDVYQAVNIIEPDSVCVELCDSRYAAITNRDHWKNMNIFNVIREGKSMLLLSSLIMSSYQRKIGKNLGITAGAEMLEGVKLAKEKELSLVLADRDIQVTLKRTWRLLPFFKKMKLFFQLAASIFSQDEIDSQSIDDLKKEDQLDEILKEFADSFPTVKKVLIDERDIYLAHSIQKAQGKKILAVLGAGHLPGVKKNLTKDIAIDEIITVPNASSTTKVICWGIPAVILCLFVYGFFTVGAKHSVESLYIWIGINGVLAAIGAIIAFGHPLTILSAFIAAPITSLNPMIAAGWVSGLVQAWVKKPTVEHLERLPEEITTVKGFWHNPVTRILLVVVLSNIGSGLGTFISGSWIAARLIGK